MLLAINIATQGKSGLTNVKTARNKEEVGICKMINISAQKRETSKALN